MTWEELNTHELLVYTTTWCGDCHRFKKQLDNHNISYNEIDIDADPEAAKRLQKKTGRTAIPFLEIDGGHIVRGWHSECPGKWDDATFLREVEEGL